MNEHFEGEKTKILGMVDSMKKSNLEYEDKIRVFEKQVLDLTQQRDNALIVKVRLEVSSLKLENMFSSHKSGNNKEGLHILKQIINLKPSLCLLNPPIKNQASMGLVLQNLKKFIDRTPHKPKLKRMFKKGIKLLAKNHF